eukprot:COSAG02_NODE_2014_length_10107_cov_30.598821_2_plen_62_part_00
MIRIKYLCMLQMQSSNIISEAPSQITNEVLEIDSNLLESRIFPTLQPDSFFGLECRELTDK